MDFVDQVKSAVDIVGVVREYVPSLKRSGGGARYFGLCPFHTEKTGSFSVHATHQFYKCFGCGASGDVIKFVMEMERFTFWEALKHLAERNGIPLPKRGELADKEAHQRGGIHEMHDLAAQAYRDLLHSPAGEEARAYLQHRGLSRETAEQFSLGLSDRGGQMLVRLFERRGFPHEDMESAGLVRRRQDASGFYDVFRGRLMFPIHSETGRIIAFGARALAADDQPKYLNSADSPVYEKRSVLYNLNRARKAIHDAGFSILVEGYMDVIGVYAAGFEHVVASCGTALTNYQVRSLRRHAPEVVVNFDPDNAGANATEKSIPILLQEGARLRVLSLSGGLDPDDYIKTNGAEAYKEALANARSYFHWLADRARTRFDLHTPDGRVAAFQFLLPAIQKMPDKLDRLAVASDVADYLKMEPGIVLDEFRRAAAGRRAQVWRREEVTLDPNEVLILHALLSDPQTRLELFPTLRQLSSLERFQARPIFEVILQMVEAGQTPSFSEVEARLDEPGKALLISLVFADETLTEKFTTEQAVACVRRLVGDEPRARRADLRRRIQDAERAGDLQTALELTEKLNRL